MALSAVHSISTMVLGHPDHRVACTNLSDGYGYDRHGLSSLNNISGGALTWRDNFVIKLNRQRRVHLVPHASSSGVVWKFWYRKPVPRLILGMEYEFHYIFIQRMC